VNEKRIFKVIYLLLALSVVTNVVFFVQWLGGSEASAGTGREQETAVKELEEENTKLRVRIDELLAADYPASPEEGTEEAKESGGSQPDNLGEKKKLEFLKQFAQLQFGMSSDKVSEHVAKLENLMSAESFQQLNGTLQGGASPIAYTVAVKGTEIYRNTSSDHPNEYILVVSQETKTDQENATPVQSKLYYRIQLGTSEEGSLVVEAIHALMPYQ